MSRNTIMGIYTYFANPLDLCAVSVPGTRREDGLPSAVCFTAPAGQDGTLRAIASYSKPTLCHKPGAGYR